jgi:hypothetical protein
MITLAITHCNRLKYLRALINSMSDFIAGCNPQLLLVDNCSDESGSAEFFDDLREKGWDVTVRQDRNWINDEYIAKNIIISKAKHDVILFLQDDAELVVPWQHLSKLIDAFREMPHFSMEIEGVRRVTVQRRTGASLRDEPGVHEKIDPHFPTHGLFKTAVLRENGEYPTSWPLDRAYWGRSEDWYDKHLKERHLHTHLSCISRVPCFVSVWNDPRGGYAFIRGDKRFGHYRSPVGKSYYTPITPGQVERLDSSGRPSVFLDIARPCGWRIALDPTGEIYKYPQSQILIEGPSAPLESSDDN